MAKRSGLMQPLVVGAAVLSPLASHAALALGRGYGVAVTLAAVQAVAAGLAIRGANRPGAGAALGLLLLGALAAGAIRSGPDALLVSAGVSHAALYGVLLLVFARSLRPGRESVVTLAARRLNPAFHAGMVPYTRGVTWAWCGFFAGQLAVSAVLLAAAPGGWAAGWWAAWVMTVHAPLVLAMAVAEFLVRRWRWRGQHYTGLRETITGVRQMARAGGGRTSR